MFYPNSSIESRLIILTFGITYMLYIFQLGEVNNIQSDALQLELCIKLFNGKCYYDIVRGELRYRSTK